MAFPVKLGQLLNPEVKRCWTDVRTETGFDTYRQYLNEFCDGESQLTKFMDDGTTLPRIINGNCVLYDVSETGSLSKTFEVKLEDLSAGFTEILIALRNPTSEAVLRVLLLEPTSMEQKLPGNLIDVIGLGLRVTPDFFKAYLARNNAPTEFSTEIPLRASHGVIGRAAVMVSRSYLPASPNCPPVILFMGHPAPPDSYKGLLPSRQTDPLAFAQPVAVRPQGLAKYPWPWMFERLFRVNIQDFQTTSLDPNAALVYTLLPLLQVCLERLKRAWDRAFDQYRYRFGISSHENETLNIWKNAQEDHEHEMEQVRFRLGRWIRYYEECSNAFMRYLRAQGVKNIRSFEAYCVVNEEANEVLTDARNLETQIHDWLQLRVSSLALQESKKSIEISNLQIEESQRGTVPSH